MKNIVGLLFVCIIFLPWKLNAQENIKEEQSKTEFEQLSDLLELEEEQSAKTKMILTSRHQKLKANRPDRATMSSMTQSERREKLMAMRSAREAIEKETNEELKNVLTVEQMELYLEYVKDRREKQREQRRGSRMQNQQPDMHQQEDW